MNKQQLQELAQSEGFEVSRPWWFDEAHKAGGVVCVPHRNNRGVCTLASMFSEEGPVCCDVWPFTTGARAVAIKNIRAEVRLVHPDYKEQAKRFAAKLIEATGKEVTAWTELPTGREFAKEVEA